MDLSFHISSSKIAWHETVIQMQDPNYLYDPNNETGGGLVPAQIIYDAFHRRYQSATGAVVFMCIIWGSFFFCGLSVTASAARVVSKTILTPHLHCKLLSKSMQYAYWTSNLKFPYALIRFMLYLEIKEFHFHQFGEKFIPSTRFQGMQCGSVRSSACFSGCPSWNWT